MAAWDFVPRPVSSPLVFVLCLPPAWALSVLLHELGHVAFGRLASDWIVAAGLGSGRPYWKRKIGGTVYYIAKNFWLMGLTLRGLEGVYPNRRRFLLSVLGGPAASLVTTAAALVIWNRLTPSEPVAALFFASLWASQTILPYATRRRDGTMLLSDGMLILRTWQGRLRGSLPPAQALRNLSSFRQFAAELGIPDAEASYGLVQSLLLIELGALAEAEKLLNDPKVQKAAEFSRLARLNGIARASFAVTSNPNTAGPRPLLDRARALCGEGTSEEVMLLLLMADAQTDPVAKQATFDEAARRSRSTGWRDLAALANARAQLLARPVETAQFLNGDGRRDLGQLDRLGLAVELIPILTKQGREKEAAELFWEATRVMEAAAADLPDEEVRRVFLAKFSEPLRAAVAASDPAAPIWMGGHGQSVGIKADAISASARRTGALAAVGLFGLLLVEIYRGQISQETWTRLYFQLSAVLILGLCPAYYLFLLTRTGRPLRRGGAFCMLILVILLVIVSALTAGRSYEISRRPDPPQTEPIIDGQMAHPEGAPVEGSPQSPRR